MTSRVAWSHPICAGSIMADPDPQPPAFPLEAIFPGLHAERPDIAEAEGLAYLAHGHKPIGFDLADPSMRASLLDCNPFVDFAIRPVPDFVQKWIDELPGGDDWQNNPDSFALAEQINVALEKHFDLLPRFYVSLNEIRVPWVSLNRSKRP